jgi:hypothetical protein
MKSIKKIVAASTLTVTLFSFSFNPEPVEARGLACLLFGCKKAVVKDTDPLYGDPPDYDSLYGKVPPHPERYNPDGPSPYGLYGNSLENIMGRDIREIIELDKRYRKRPPGSGSTDNKTSLRALEILPLGKLEKSVPLGNGNTAYVFKYSAGYSGSPGTPDRLEPTIAPVPFTRYGVQTIYNNVSGNPATAGNSLECTTYIVTDQYGKLFYWSYQGTSDSKNDCSSDERRLK